MKASHKKLNVAFIWHMHQPYYKDEFHGIYAMPWVRLHGVKDYYPMASILDNFSGVKVTFNMVPVLIEQINDYVHNQASDTFLERTLAKPHDLSLREKLVILKDFFRVNYKHCIEPNKRYFDLLMKRGIDAAPVSIKRHAPSFSNQDILDLQVLFNLSWFHSVTVEQDQHLQYLKEKKTHYSEDDKRYVIEKQMAVLAAILPLYRRLQAEGKIEVTASPYYHPILPLLCDTDVAKVASPKISLPQRRFSQPDDARYHIDEALAYHKKQFGKSPLGMWPPEGAVSDTVLRLFMDAGIHWVVTDEDILFKTLADRAKEEKAKHPPDRNALYRPYLFQKGDRSLTVIFRDKNLSNLISFQYNSWDPAAAAADLFWNLKKIQESMPDQTREGLVAIVMDGENAWEHYEDNGRRFFDALYSRLDQDPSIRATTVSEYLQREKPKERLHRIHPGSWVNRNFEVWIGGKQKNLAWDYLLRAREALVRSKGRYGAAKNISPESLKKGWRELFIAQGSDWNWWHTFESGTSGEHSFETLFRMHLKNIYHTVKVPLPRYLKK